MQKTFEIRWQQRLMNYEKAFDQIDNEALLQHIRDHGIVFFGRI